MENLNDMQTEFLRKYINTAKFSDLARQAGCSIEAVRAFAPVVFAEHAAKDAAKQAKQEAEEQQFLGYAKRLLQAGDMNAVRTFWLARNAADVAWDVEMDNQEVCNDAKEYILEKYEKELHDYAQKKLYGQIKAELEKAFSSFLEELKA